MYNPFSLEGKTILVTGASSGIGRAIAIECSKMGAAVILSARNEERLKNTLSLMDNPHQHCIILADLNNEEERKIFINNVTLINGLVHCAGITKTLPFPFIDIDVLTSVMNVNFTAPVLITAELIKKKKIAKNSSVVFVSSIGGVLCADPGNSIYSASKGAINGIVKNMAVELASKRIRVNCVNPGLIKTNLLDSYTVTEEQFNEKIKEYPLKRYGKPEEVAYAVIYLLSDASNFTTGSNLVIDGGFTLL
jgi:NAD(P)-dependent dehydrogenase (short-subunit alcohol dehydrogenase family)